MSFPVASVARRRAEKRKDFLMATLNDEPLMGQVAEKLDTKYGSTIAEGETATDWKASFRRDGRLLTQATVDLGTAEDDRRNAVNRRKRAVDVRNTWTRRMQGRLRGTIQDVNTTYGTDQRWVFGLDHRPLPKAEAILTHTDTVAHRFLDENLQKPSPLVEQEDLVASEVVALLAGPRAGLARAIQGVADARKAADAAFAARDEAEEEQRLVYRSVAGRTEHALRLAGFTELADRLRLSERRTTVSVEETSPSEETPSSEETPPEETPSEETPSFEETALGQEVPV